MNFLNLAKSSIYDVDWLSEFNPENLLNYKHSNVSRENILDKSDYITAEECSNVLIDKMKVLRQLYAEELHALKKEYITEKSQIISPYTIPNNPLLQQKSILKAYSHYRRPHGKTGDYIIRSRNRHWQFINFFGHTHKYLRKKYQNYLFGGYLNSASSTASHQQTQCRYVLDSTNNLLNQNTDNISFLLESKSNTAVLSSPTNKSTKRKKRKRSSATSFSSIGQKGSKKLKGKTLKKNDSSSNIGATMNSDNSNINRCTKLSLPFSPFCHTHILNDARQVLFSQCGGKTGIISNIHDKNKETHSNKELKITLSDPLPERPNMLNNPEPKEDICSEINNIGKEPTETSCLMDSIKREIHIGSDKLCKIKNEELVENITIKKEICQTPVLNLSMYDKCPFHN